MITGLFLFFFQFVKFAGQIRVTFIENLLKKIGFAATVKISKRLQVLENIAHLYFEVNYFHKCYLKYQNPSQKYEPISRFTGVFYAETVKQNFNILHQPLFMSTKVFIQIKVRCVNIF